MLNKCTRLFHYAWTKKWGAGQRDVVYSLCLLFVPVSPFRPCCPLFRPVPFFVLRFLSWSGETSRRAGRPTNLNQATHAGTESLPGIGPMNARRIIESRPDRSVNELEPVKGIGQKRLGEIRPLVTAE